MRYLSSTATSLTLIIAHSFPAGLVARRWTDIVSKKQKTPRDRFRYNLLLESDDATGIPATPPTNGSNGESDGAKPKPNKSEAPTRRPTHPPTLRPTLRPTTPMTPAPVVPTAPPTPASLCPAGQMAYEVHMYDRFGDGWDGTSLKISHAFGYEESFRGTLQQGHKAVQGACLSATKCHRVSIEGVSPWNSEIYWEIYAQQADGTLVKVAYGEDVGSVSSIGRNNNGYSTGGGGGGCTFDPKGGRSGVLAGCFNTCRDPNDALPAQSNSEYEAPRVVPTRKPTDKPTDKPTPYIAEIRPNGYFNYNQNDLEYGPSAWRDVDTSGNIWEAYTSIDASNQCGTNPSMQSPITLPQQGTSTCRSRRQMRSRSRRFNTCDGDSGTFEITPTRLRVRFGRGYEPTLVLPEGNNGIEAAYMEVSVPSLHQLTKDDGTVQKYDAEYTIYYPWANKGRIVAISVLIDAVSGAQDNVMFQRLIDGWSEVNSCSHSFRQRDRILQDGVEDRGASLNHATEQRKLQCDFDIFHKSLVPSIYYYSYYGTLSEPPCTSNTNWKVIEKPMIVSVAQLQQMNALLSQGPCKDDEFADDLKGRVRAVQADAGRAIEQCNTRNYWLDCNNNCDCSEELCPRDFQGRSTGAGWQ